MLLDSEGRVSSVLRTHLATAAHRHALKAVRSFVTNDLNDFYLQAGVGLELAIKSKLCGFNPVFLAPQSADWFKHAVALTRDSVVSPGKERVGTVGAEQALNRLRILSPTLSDVFRDHVAVILSMRNHVAQIGLAPESDRYSHRSNASAFFRAINTLLQIPRRTFWGDYTDLADELVKEDEINSKATVTEKLVTARLYFESLLATQVDERRAAADFEADLAVGATVVKICCPVCASTGLVRGSPYDDRNPDFDLVHGGSVISWFPDPKVFGQSFECVACGLSLDGEDEVRIAGLPSSVSNENADLHEIWNAETDIL